MQAVDCQDKWKPLPRRTAKAKPRTTSKRGGEQFVRMAVHDPLPVDIYRGEGVKGGGLWSGAMPPNRVKAIEWWMQKARAARVEARATQLLLTCDACVLGRSHNLRSSNSGVSG